MIIDLPNTTVSAISKALVNLREEGGAVALGRVLTLVIMTRPDHVEDAIAAVAWPGRSSSGTIPMPRSAA